LVVILWRIVSVIWEGRPEPKTAVSISVEVVVPLEVVVPIEAVVALDAVLHATPA